jgi:hypothetical protein
MNHDHATAPTSWNDFNDAEAQQGGFDLIPRASRASAHDDQTRRPR